MRLNVSMVSLLVVLAASVISNCASDDGDRDEQVCEPGDVKSCPCAGGSEGVQTCDSNGTTWGTCEGCEEICMPSCIEKECGDDGCEGSCGYCDYQEICVDGKCTGCGNGICHSDENTENCDIDCVPNTCVVTRAEGDKCDSDWDCWNVLPDYILSCLFGVCSAQRTTGESCDSDPDCEPTRACLFGYCLDEYHTLGENCDSDFDCSEGCQSGVCVEKETLGGTCDSPYDCTNGYTCIDKRCSPYATTGEACDFDDNCTGAEHLNSCLYGVCISRGGSGKDLFGLPCDSDGDCHGPCLGAPSGTYY